MERKEKATEPPKNTRVHRLHRKLKDDRDKAQKRVESLKGIKVSWKTQTFYEGVVKGCELALFRIEDLWEDEDFSL